MTVAIALRELHHIPEIFGKFRFFAASFAGSPHQLQQKETEALRRLNIKNPAMLRGFSYLISSPKAVMTFCFHPSPLSISCLSLFKKAVNWLNATGEFKPRLIKDMLSFLISAENTGMKKGTRVGCPQVQDRFSGFLRPRTPDLCLNRQEQDVIRDKYSSLSASFSSVRRFGCLLEMDKHPCSWSPLKNSVLFAS